MFIHDRPFLLTVMSLSKPIVMKFGGTSVEDAHAFERVAHIVSRDQDSLPVVVVSAMSGMTDALLTSAAKAAQGDFSGAMGNLDRHFARHSEIVAKLDHEDGLTISAYIDSTRREIEGLLRLLSLERYLSPEAEDKIAAYGELLSSHLIAAFLRGRGIKAELIDSRCCIVTDDEHGCAAPLTHETFAALRRQLGAFARSEQVPVLGGFVGATVDGKTTTLGRGGSDYTAALVGAATEAQEIQIWTDVCGVMTADPRVVPNARRIDHLSYAEAAELAYFGAKVLHPKTIQPAVEAGIPVRVCNSRAPEEAGTLVCATTGRSPRTVKAIAHRTGVTTVQVTSSRMLGAYGFLRAIFEIFERHRTVVDVVATSEVSVSLSLDDAGGLATIVEELQQLGTVTVDANRAIVCVVGEGLRGTPGIAARVFSTIDDINVTLISQGASSINLTFAIEESRIVEAVARLHEAFFSEVNYQSSQFKVRRSGYLCTNT